MCNYLVKFHGINDYNFDSGNAHITCNTLLSNADRSLNFYCVFLYLSTAFDNQPALHQKPENTFIFCGTFSL